MRISTLAACTALTILTAPALAQLDEREGPRVVNVSFRGGTLDQYIDVLRAAMAPRPVNVVLRGDAAEFLVPEIQLEGVALDTAIRLVLPQAQAGVYALPDGTQKSYVYELGFTRGKDGYQEAWTIGATLHDANQPQQGVIAGPAERQLEIFSLSEILKGPFTIEDVISAVETAVGLQETSSQAAQLRYHADTGLLILNGSADQITTARRVINSIYDTAEVSTNERAELEIEIINMENRVTHLRYGVREREIKLQVAADQLEEVERHRAEALVSDADVRRQQFAVEEASVRVEMARSELDAAVRRLEVLQARIGDLGAAESAGLEVRTYALGAVGMDSASQIGEVLNVIAEVSPHIAGVEAFTSPGGTSDLVSIVVRADGKGHRAIERLLELLSAR